MVRLLCRDLSHSSAKHLRLGLRNCVGYALNHCSCTLHLSYFVLEHSALQLCTYSLLLILRLNCSSHSAFDLRAAPKSSFMYAALLEVNCRTSLGVPLPFQLDMTSPAQTSLHCPSLDIFKSKKAAHVK
ncbi:protein arginine N-methyltransferase 1.5 [Dorcoceras hygrometricum]|uniref:Protein arginine N-methyltransferase 1.5 n=1 Tax=Dorcoceras hygrometricum TaxID=472368 RepID=A0A2Z7AD18_9LAMI|nr:protein arginine N-methyltransferase 1.5 [Dorcoceras hygrometricum]